MIPVHGRALLAPVGKDGPHGRPTTWGAIRTACLHTRTSSYVPPPQTFAKFDTTAPELEAFAGELGIKALPAFHFFKVGL